MEIYKTKQGDTFDSIAYAFYGNEYYFIDIIEANPFFRKVIVFDEGIELKMPSIDTEDFDENTPEWLAEVNDINVEDEEVMEASSNDS